MIDNLWVYSVKKRLNVVKMKIETNSRVMTLRFEKNCFKSWRKIINIAIDQSPWSHKLPRLAESSYAPLRKNNKVRLMIDGELYFKNVAEELMKAQSEIFITDWWLCAKYYLIRPVNLNVESDQ